LPNEVCPSENDVIHNDTIENTIILKLMFFIINLN
jgi:hypothetical protein